VNSFEEDSAAMLELLKVDPALEPEQKRRVAAVRKRRNSQAALEACRAVEDAARSSENLIPKIRAAVRAYATLGEISDAMRRAFGEHRPATTV
jgi:methylmalonyl-CoA mutase N-terminal domain/subunit